jgi:hypothetical protein
MEVPEVPETATCNRHHAVSLLLANDPLLLDFVFLPNRRSLTFGTPVKALRVARRVLDEQQRLQVHLALTIWFGRGRVSFVAACDVLSGVRFEAFLKALELLHAAGGCSCQTCIQRELAWPTVDHISNDYF